MFTSRFRLLIFCTEELASHTQIKKNIAAISQNRPKCFGKKKLKFSEALGLPRFILQSFLKGNAGLRSDSFEELTKCLGFIPAQLISSLEYAQAYCTSHLDSLSAEIQSLHPQAQTLAQEAVSLLNTAFRISAELERLDRLSDTTQHDSIHSVNGIRELVNEGARE